MIDLYKEFHEFHVKGVPDRLQVPFIYDNKVLRSKLEEILTAEDSTILIAELDSQVVGLAEVYLKHDEIGPLTKSYTYAYLQSMMVNGPYRKQNIGGRLLRAAEQWAKRKDAAEMRLNTWEFEAGPLQFYEKHGYRTLRRTMVRKL